MGLNKLSKPIIWVVTISSRQNLSNENRDFIVELVSEEARKVRASDSFILHDVVESKKYSKTLIEGTRGALINLLSVLKDNLPYNVAYTSSINKPS